LTLESPDLSLFAMWTKRAVVVAVVSVLAMITANSYAHDQAFSDPNDSIHAGDLKRVSMSHGGGRYTFKARMWDDFTNRQMRPGRGVSWELDTVDAAGQFEFDHQVVLNWMRYRGNRRYRCRILRESTGNFVGNFPGQRDGRTVKCPNIPDREWHDRPLFDWNVVRFYESTIDNSGPHQHLT
jgi:hypothetical protein